jgi:Tfp pilus assembly protein PilF
MRHSILLALAAAGCVAAPPVHPRARESNDRCSDYLAQGDLTTAEVQCDLGLQFSPTYDDLWVNKGLIAFKRDQMDLAKEHFIKAIRYNQEQAQAYNNLGIIHLRERGYDKARHSFQRALQVNPDYREARYNLGVAYYHLGKREDAKKQFRTLVAVAPELADSYKELGMIALEDGDVDVATAELKRAVDRDPRLAAAWLYLGVAHAKAARYEEAKSAFGSCLAAEPNNPECRKNLSAMNRDLGAH